MTEGRKSSRPTINLDAIFQNADWTKRTWDLPPYKSREFMDHLNFCKMTLDQFRDLPVYKFAVEKGRIVNDEWNEDF